MTAHRDNLIAALQGIAKFHLADHPPAQIEMMDTSEELYARWHGAYIKRDWFLAHFTEEQRGALAAEVRHFGRRSRPLRPRRRASQQTQARLISIGE